MSKKYFLILPGCDDTNRGDQALVWETINLVQKAGFEGEHYILADEKCCTQSRSRGIKNVGYLLPHPSTYFRQSDNIHYSKVLKIKWTLVSIMDLMKCIPLLSSMLRPIIYKFLGKRSKEIIDLFQGASAAFVKGGGFLHAYGGMISSYRVFFFLYHIRFALSCGVKVYVMPNSFGPFRGLFVRRMISATLSKCIVIMSRESLSQKTLQEECGVRSVLMSDLGFFLQQDEHFDAVSALKARNIPVSEKRCVAITVRPYRFPGIDNTYLAYMKYKRSISDFMIWLSKNEYYPVLVEHVYCELQHEQDIVCINEIVEMIGSKSEFGVFSNRELSCIQMKSIYACFNYTIGTRFHSVIFSLSEFVPSIAITYGGNKGIGIMHDMGLDEYSCSIDDISLIRLQKMFSSLVLGEADIKKILKEHKNVIAKEESEIIALLKE